MLMQLLVVCGTAVLSSLMTLLVVVIYWVRKLQPALIAELESRVDALEPRVRDRVREGVREGINEGFADVRKKMAKSAASGGLDVIEEGINQWFRRGRSSD